MLKKRVMTCLLVHAQLIGCIVKPSKTRGCRRFLLPCCIDSATSDGMLHITTARAGGDGLGLRRDNQEAAAAVAAAESHADTCDSCTDDRLFMSDSEEFEQRDAADKRESHSYRRWRHRWRRQRRRQQREEEKRPSCSRNRASSRHSDSSSARLREKKAEKHVKPSMTSQPPQNQHQAAAATAAAEARLTGDLTHLLTLLISELQTLKSRQTAAENQAGSAVARILEIETRLASAESAISRFSYEYQSRQQQRHYQNLQQQNILQRQQQIQLHQQQQQQMQPKQQRQEKNMQQKRQHQVTATSRVPMQPTSSVLTKDHVATVTG
uniref:Uncharacterized protein n=1 Tax=Macrostomum lignano TaxID=282301 RepID=A0A1I8H6T3_9PLAT